MRIYCSTTSNDYTLQKLMQKPYVGSVSSSPRQTPDLILDTDEAKRRNSEALMRRKNRLELRAREEKCKRDGVCPV